MRIGHGYDVHRLTQGRDLILGGVKIPYDLGLDGHSDADVLVHAVMDALLGAAGLGRGERPCQRHPEGRKGLPGSYRQRHPGPGCLHPHALRQDLCLKISRFKRSGAASAAPHPNRAPAGTVCGGLFCALGHTTGIWKKNPKFMAMCGERGNILEKTCGFWRIML